MTLDQIPDHLWSLLEQAVANGSDPFHTPAIATSGPGGPDVRTVVLRRADPSLRLLTFHTDLRAPKVASIHADPRIQFLFYDPQRRLQIRASAIARVHANDPESLDAWNHSRLSSRRCYLIENPPGHPLSTPGDGIPEPLRHRAPSEQEAAPGYPNFALVRALVHGLDWLHLTATGHRRAQFVWDHAWHGSWIQG